MDPVDSQASPQGPLDDDLLDDFFVVGGTLHPGSECYIERRVDRRLLELCRQRKYCSVLSPRQTGKSSLMARTARALRAEGVRVAVLDLNMIGSTPDLRQWYLGVSRVLVRELRIDLDLSAWWRERDDLPPVQCLDELFREVLLVDSEEPLVLFVDEIDATLELPFTDDFFTALRAFSNAQATDPVYQRMSCVLLGVAHASELIKEATKTPYNVGESLELDDFDREEAKGLVPGLGLPEPLAEQVLDAALAWTGGHPFLTQKLLAEVAQQRASIPDDALEVWVGERVRELFCIPEALRRDSNLSEIPRRLGRATLPERRQQLQLYRQVLSGGLPAASSQSRPAGQLKLLGLVSVDDLGRLRVRNKIYRKLFNEHWVDSEMPTESNRVNWLLAGLLGLAMLGLVVSVWVHGELQALSQAENEPPTASYEILRGWPRVGAQATRLYAKFWEEKAERAEENGDLAAALLFELEALAVEERESGDESEARRCRIEGLEKALLDLETVLHDPEAAPILALSATGEWWLAAEGELGSEGVLRSRPALPAEANEEGWQLGSVTAELRVGNLLVVGAQDGGITLYAVEGGPPQRLVTVPFEAAWPASAVRNLAVSADRAFLAASDASGVRLFRWRQEAAPRLQRILSLQQEGLEHVALSRQGQLMALVTEHGEVEILEVATSLRSVLELEEPLERVAFDPQGYWLFAGGRDLVAWRLTNIGLQERPRMLKSGAPIKVLEAVGDRLMIGRESGDVELWNLAPQRRDPRNAPLPEPLVSYRLRNVEVTALAIEPGGERVLVGTRDGEIVTWRQRGIQNLSLGLQVSRLAAGGARGQGVGRRLAVGSVAGRLDVWRLGNVVEGVKLNHPTTISALAFGEAGRYLASGDVKGNVQLLDLAREPLVVDPMPHPSRAITALAVHDSRGLVAVGTDKHEVVLWKTSGVQRLDDLSALSTRVEKLDFSSSGLWLFAEDAAANVKLYDLSWVGDAVIIGPDDQEPREPMPVPERSTESWSLPEAFPRLTVSAFADGEPRWLATGHIDGQVFLWDLNRPRPLETPRAKTRFGPGPITALSFDRNGSRLFAGDVQGTLRAWIEDDGQLKAPTSGLGSSSWWREEHQLAENKVTSDSSPSRAVRAFSMDPQGRLLAVLAQRQVLTFSAPRDPQGAWRRNTSRYLGWSDVFWLDESSIQIATLVGRSGVTLQTIPIHQAPEQPADELRRSWEKRLLRTVVAGHTQTLSDADL